MNTIDATPHVSGGDVSPCSVRATRSLNWHSVQIPRTTPLLGVNPRTSTEKLSGVKEMEQICAVIAPAYLRGNPCNAMPRGLHFSSARHRCVYRNLLCFSPRARRGSSWPDRLCDMAWRAATRRRQDGHPRSWRSPNSRKCTESAALGPRLQLVEMVKETVLVEAGDPLAHVYLPHSGAISMMVRLSGGQTVEVARR